jgi:E3 ubiquitin-protein ligase MARCH6
MFHDSDRLIEEIGDTNSVQETFPVAQSWPLEIVQQTRPAEPVALPPTMIERVSEWLWGGINPSPPTREDGANTNGQRLEPPQELQFAPIRNRPWLEREIEVDNQWQDPAVAGIDPNDIDAAEDADDLEGVMELIGMHGPIFGLLQNGVFSALLIAITVAIGIWLPYLWGKIALVLLTNPIRLFVGVPLTIFSVVADITVDTLIGSLGYVVYWGNILLRTLLGHLGRFMPLLGKIAANNFVSSASLSLIDGSSQRLRRVMEAFFTFHESDLPMFSILSHQALRIHEARVAKILQFLYDIGKAIVYDLPLFILQQSSRPQLFGNAPWLEFTNIVKALTSSLQFLGKSALFFSDMHNWPTSDAEQTAIPSDYDLARWDTKDRVIAIIVGYCFASVLGVLYLRISALISGVRHEQRFDGIVADVLQQAGGVMKVILIIGIEMIVFPLYCGILLDLALMPLFENATLMSRTAFTLESPLTSFFVHWFIGTCYMFHFALFVSMCRKIMRTGVLCKCILCPISSWVVVSNSLRFHSRP